MSATETSSGNAYEITGIDLSVRFRSQPIWLGPGDKRVSFEASWTGTPTGAWTFETMNDETDATGAPTPGTAAAAWLAKNPAGSAGAAFGDRMPTAALYGYIVWTPSGGAGTGKAILARGV